jgi:hypothetical protein
VLVNSAPGKAPSSTLVSQPALVEGVPTTAQIHLLNAVKKTRDGQGCRW